MVKKSIVSHTVKMAGERYNKYGYAILLAILAIIIFILAVYRIGELNQIKIYSDEFGYWTGSAFLTGDDWSSVTSGIFYYSYGYGILLIPIRLLLNDSGDMYRAAVLLNGIMLVVSYCFAVRLGSRYFERFDRTARAVICFIAVVYPSNIVQAHIAWDEVTLTLLFWIFAWLMMKVCDKPSVGNHIALSVIVCYQYVVHQRSLGIMIAAAMMILYMKIRKVNNWKQTIIFFAVMIICMVVHGNIKTALINDFYNNNSQVAINNLSGQVGNLKNIFTGGGFLRLIFSVIGKWLYLAASTGLLLFWGMRDLWYNMWHLLIEFIRDPRGQGNGDKSKLWKLAMLLAFAGTFSITAIYMSGIGRMDNLMYGRYNEFILGLYFTYSIYCFMKDEHWIKHLVIYTSVTFIMGWLCQYILNSVENTIFEPAHCITMSLFLKNGELPTSGVNEFVLCSVLVGVLFMVLMKWKKLIECKINNTILASSVFAAVYLYISIHSVNTYIVPTHNSFSEVLTPIAKEINTSAKKDKIYFLSDTVWRGWAEGFQFQLPDKPVTVVSSTELSFEGDAYYIMGSEFVQNEKMLKNCTILVSNRMFTLAVGKSY